METRAFLDSRSISGLPDWPWHCLARLLVFSALFAREYCATVDLRDFQAFRKMLFDHWTNSSWLLWIKNCYSAEIKPKQHSGSKVFCLNGTQIRAGPGGCLCSLFWSPLESGNPIAKSLLPDLRNMVSQICLFQTHTFILWLLGLFQERNSKS